MDNGAIGGYAVDIVAILLGFFLIKHFLKKRSDKKIKDQFMEVLNEKTRKI